MNKQTFITIVVIAFAALMISLAQCTSSSESPDDKAVVADDTESPLLLSFFRTYTLANGYSFDQMVVKCGLLRTELSGSLRSNSEDKDLAERRQAEEARLVRLYYEDREAFLNVVEANSSEAFYGYYHGLCSYANTYPEYASETLPDLESIEKDVRLSDPEKETLISLVGGLKNNQEYQSEYSGNALRSGTGGSAGQQCTKDFNASVRRCNEDFIVHSGVTLVAGILVPGGEVAAMCVELGNCYDYYMCNKRAREAYDQCQKANSRCKLE